MLKRATEVSNALEDAEKAQVNSTTFSKSCFRIINSHYFLHSQKAAREAIAKANEDISTAKLDLEEVIAFISFQTFSYGHDFLLLTD